MYSFTTQTKNLIARNIAINQTNIIHILIECFFTFPLEEITHIVGVTNNTPIDNIHIWNLLLKETPIYEQEDNA